MQDQEIKQTIIKVFHELFMEEYQTVLVDQGNEPLYRPATDTQNMSQIIFAHGYWNSALHEIAHWCVAGAERRKLVDYGYWYKPDGRNAQEQRQFELVEVKPQALEWLFTSAVGARFHLSLDNLTGVVGEPSDFAIKVRAQALEYLLFGMPLRAGSFLAALKEAFDQNEAFTAFWQVVERERLLPS